MAYRPKHFKVHCSLKNHRKTAEMFVDNDMLAAYIRLGILSTERFAQKTGGTFMVHDRELGWIFGKHRADVARKSLQRLADISPISAERNGDVWSITIPNLAKKQGFGSQAVPKQSASYTDTHTDTHTDTKKRAKPSQKAASPRESPDTPVEDWAWLVPILGGKRLLAKSTEDELRMWLDVRYDEIAARIRSEVEPDKVWDGIKAHAISAWTMYLKTRDPTQRQFYREVATRQKSAAIQALDAQLESQARASPPDANADEIDDDDPLRFMKLGANPHAH